MINKVDKKGNMYGAKFVSNAGGPTPEEDLYPNKFKPGGGGYSNPGWPPYDNGGSAPLPNGFNLPTGGPQFAPGSGPQSWGGNSDAINMMKQLFKSGTSDSLASFDTAANRLRERLDSAASGQSSAAASNSAARGMGFSGIQDNAQRNIRNDMMRQYAQGMNDLSLGFEDRRLAGLNSAFGAANALMNQGQFGDKLKFDYDKMFNDAGLAKYLLNKQIQAGKDSQGQDFEKWLMSKYFDNWNIGG